LLAKGGVDLNVFRCASIVDGNGIGRQFQHPLVTLLAFAQRSFHRFLSGQVAHDTAKPKGFAADITQQSDDGLMGGDRAVLADNVVFHQLGRLAGLVDFLIDMKYALSFIGMHIVPKVQTDGLFTGSPDKSTGSVIDECEIAGQVDFKIAVP